MQVWLWQEVWQQSQQQRLGRVAAAIGYSWLMAFGLGAFGLINTDQAGLMPLIRGLSQLLVHLGGESLAVAGAGRVIVPIPRFWSVAAMVIALWLAQWGLGQLMETIEQLSQGTPVDDPTTWSHRFKLWAGLLVLIGWTASLLVLIGLTAPHSAGPTPAVPLLTPGFTLPLAPTWPLALWQWLRWPVLWGWLATGTGLIYRLSLGPQFRTLPLWPGAWYSSGTTLLVLALISWITASINPGLPYSQLLVLVLVLLLAAINVLLLLGGAIVNLSLARHRRRQTTWIHSPGTQPPPPSFESFTIRRRRSD